jgi:HEAT repeat protein
MVLTFKYYLKETDERFGYKDLLLNEELTDDQKSIVDNWGDGSAARALSNHVFPKGQDKLEIPLKMDEGPVEPHPDVQKHLEDNGYTISDYRGGYATDKYGRSTSIGKILNKTKAPQDITSAFLNDPKRAASSVAQPKIIISRHPHDVAGMSTDRGWRSCMTMGGGCNEHYLRHDIQNGTHVAYLVRPEDNDIKKPMARIALKPFHSGSEEESNYLSAMIHGDKPLPQSSEPHTILRPESQVYGIGKSRNNNDPYDNKAEGVDSGILGVFKRSVNNWASENFPAKEGTTYEKNDRVYNDDGRTTIMPFEKQIKHENSDLVAQAFEDHPDKITPEHVEYGINHRSPSVREAAVKHDLSTPEQVLKISHDRTYEARRAALKNPKLPQARLEDVLLNVGGDEYAQEDRYSALKNPNVPSELLHAIVKDKDDDLRYDAIQHPNVWSETLGEIAKSSHYKDSNLIGLAVKHPNFKANQIHDFLDNPAISSFAKQKVFKNPNITSDHVSKVLNDKNSNRDLINAAIEHPKAGSKNLETFFKSESIDTRTKRMILSEHPKITSKHIDTIMGLSPKDSTLTHEYDILKSAAMYHSSTSPETIENVINNYPKDNFIRNAALSNGKIKPSRLEQIFNDPSEPEEAKSSTLRNSNISSNTLMGAIKGDNQRMATVALNHPTGITQEHAEAAFSHPNPNVRAQMFDDNSKFMRKEHIVNSLGDSSEKVKKAGSNYTYRLDNNDFIYAMSHPNPEVRRSAVFLDNLTKEAHSMALKDEDPLVRAYSVLHRHTTPSHIEKMIEDPDPGVRALTTVSQHIKPEHLDQLSNDNEMRVRFGVASNKKTSENTLTHLANNDPEEKVRLEAQKGLQNILDDKNIASLKNELFSNKTN